MDTESMTARRRGQTGSRASRRLRRGGEIPAVLGGLGEEPVHLAVPTEEFLGVRRSGRQLVMLVLGEEKIEALVREIQYDTFGESVLHLDLDRVKRGQALDVEVRIEFFGDPVGAEEGGVFQILAQNVNVTCLPRAIPELIEVDVRELELGGRILARDLPLPVGVTLAEEAGEEIIACVVGATIEEEVEEEEAAGAEPEVLTEKKEEGSSKEGQD